VRVGAACRPDRFSTWSLAQQLTATATPLIWRLRADWRPTHLPRPIMLPPGSGGTWPAFPAHRPDVCGVCVRGAPSARLAAGSWQARPDNLPNRPPEGFQRKVRRLCGRQTAPVCNTVLALNTLLARRVTRALKIDPARIRFCLPLAATVALCCRAAPARRHGRHWRVGSPPEWRIAGCCFFPLWHALLSRSERGGLAKRSTPVGDCTCWCWPRPFPFIFPWLGLASSGRWCPLRC